MLIRDQRISLSSASVPLGIPLSPLRHHLNRARKAERMLLSHPAGAPAAEEASRVTTCVRKNRYVKGRLGTRICSGTGAPLWAGLWGGVHDSRRHRLMPCTGYSRVPHLYQQRRGACVHGSPAATGDVTSQEGAALLSWGVHPYERNSPPKTWRA